VAVTASDQPFGPSPAWIRGTSLPSGLRGLWASAKSLRRGDRNRQLYVVERARRLSNFSQEKQEPRSYPIRARKPA